MDARHQMLSLLITYALLAGMLSNGTAMRTTTLGAIPQTVEDFLSMATRGLKAYSCSACVTTAATPGPGPWPLSPECALSEGRCLQAQATLAGRGSLGCTANDVQLASLTAAPGTTCTEGTIATLRLTAEVDVTAASRYDIGFFLAQDPATGGTNPALTGSKCFDFQLPTNIVQNPGSLTSAIDTDCCGDWKQSPNLLVTLEFQIPCIGSSGTVIVNYCASWRNQQGDICTGLTTTSPAPDPQVLSPGTVSKCKCGFVTTNIAIVRKRSITLKFDCPGCTTQAFDGPATLIQESPTEPATIGTFDLTTRSIVIGNMDASKTYVFTLTAPAGGYFIVGTQYLTTLDITVVDGKITAPTFFATLTSPYSIPICPVAGTVPTVPLTCVGGGAIDAAVYSIAPPTPFSIPGGFIGPSDIETTFTYTLTNNYQFAAGGTTATVKFKADHCTGAVTADPTSLTAVQFYTLSGFLLGNAGSPGCGGEACFPVDDAAVSVLKGGTSVTATTGSTGEYTFTGLFDPRQPYAVKHNGATIQARTDENTANCGYTNQCTGCAAPSP